MTLINQDSVKTFNEQGYIIVPNLFNEQEVRDIKSKFDFLVNNQECIQDLIIDNLPSEDVLSKFPRLADLHIINNPNMKPFIISIMLDNRLKSCVEMLLALESYAVGSAFYYKPPGGRGIGWHQDNYFLQVSPHCSLGLFIAIDSSTIDNGGFSIIPGSHVHNEIGHHDDSDKVKSLYIDRLHVDIEEYGSTVTPELNPGDGLFFSGWALHGSQPNQSKIKFRRSLIFHYMRQDCCIGKHAQPVLLFSGEERYVNSPANSGHWMNKEGNP